MDCHYPISPKIQGIIRITEVSNKHFKCFAQPIALFSKRIENKESNLDIEVSYSITIEIALPSGIEPELTTIPPGMHTNRRLEENEKTGKLQRLFYVLCL